MIYEVRYSAGIKVWGEDGSGYRLTTIETLDSDGQAVLRARAQGTVMVIVCQNSNDSSFYLYHTLNVLAGEMIEMTVDNHWSMIS